MVLAGDKLSEILLGHVDMYCLHGGSKQTFGHGGLVIRRK